MGDSIRTDFLPSSKVGQLWEDIRRYFPEQEGKREEEIFREANVGYLADPLGLRRFKNMTDTLEGAEVLGWCYARESCRPLLRKHNYPLYATMDDYDSEQWIDDQIRHEMGRDMESIQAEDPEERVRKIFEWSLEKMQFRGDCPMEFSAWEALFSNCGACSESSSALYSPLASAGLNPEFYFETDWKPSMLWLDRYYGSLKNPSRFAEDHVLLGVSGKGGRALYVDRINRQLDGEHPFALRLSPAAYNGALMGNNIANVQEFGTPEALLDWMETQEDLLPGDVFLYFRRAHFFRKFRPEVSEEMLKSAVLLFPDHPAVSLMARIESRNEEELVDELLDPESDLQRDLQSLHENFPVMASRVYLQMGIAFTAGLNNIFKKMHKVMGVRPVARPIQEKFIQLFRFTVGLYTKALLANPNAVKAYLQLLFLFEAYKDFSPRVSEIILQQSGKLVEKFPDHTPFLYLESFAYGVLSNYREEKRSLLAPGLEKLEKITQMEPDHPAAYLRMAAMHLILGEMSGSKRYFEEYRLRQKRPYPDDYYFFHLASAYQSGSLSDLREAFEFLLEDRPEDGVEVAIRLFKERFNVEMGGIVPSLQKLRESPDVQMIPQKLEVIGDVLGKYPHAQPAWEGIQAKAAIYMGICQGTERWREMFSRIAQPKRSEVALSFRQGLGMIHQWLRGSTQPEDVVDGILLPLRAIHQELGGEFDGAMLPIFVELVNNYVMLGKHEKAEGLFNEMIEIDSAKAVALFAPRVMALQYNDPRKNRLALDLVLKRRDRIAPLVLRRLREAYEGLPGRVPLKLDFKAALPPLEVPVEEDFLQNKAEKSKEEARNEYDPGQCRELTCVMSW